MRTHVMEFELADEKTVFDDSFKRKLASALTKAVDNSEYKTLVDEYIIGVNENRTYLKVGLRVKVEEWAKVSPVARSIILDALYTHMNIKMVVDEEEDGFSFTTKPEDKLMPDIIYNTNPDYVLTYFGSSTK